MFELDQYELLDFGEGRKLERFGSLIVDRPAPAAAGVLPRVRNWNADVRYRRTSGERGEWNGEFPETWSVRHAAVRFELKATPFGHLGLFPEQAANWDWIARQCRAAEQPLRVLNLFAYTGGSTLAAAAAGAQVTHVDAARNVVTWARRNAALSQLEDRPIRWICEDAAKFVQREVKRGHRYDAVILDPPSYGHGPKGEVWRIHEHLPSLLEDCGRLVDGRAAWILFTCHSTDYNVAAARRLIGDAFPHGKRNRQAAELDLQAADGRALNCGVVVRG
ncbi:MAG: class I SAM-dependent methyltransferase [Planctomycetales bacterium]|nr:class I SAM-dependent methyltransferase [Planctomycetales bacterium]